MKEFCSLAILFDHIPGQAAISNQQTITSYQTGKQHTNDVSGKAVARS